MDTNQNTKILLVEDQGIIAIEQSRMLMRNGYNVLIAKTGEKAIECFKENHDIQLVLMDIDLGFGLNGIEASEEILALREVPVVFLTSHTDQENTEKVKKINRYGFVVKNTGDFVLLSSIDMALKLFDSHQKLKLKDQQIQNITENINEVVWLRDAIENKILYISPAYEKISGMSCQSLYERPDSFLNLLNPVEPPHPGAPQQNHNEEENPLHPKFSIQRPDGQTRWVWANTYPIKNEEGKVIRCAGVARDITDLQQAEEKILESQKRFNCITNNNQILICEIGLDGKASFINPAYLSLMGYEPENLLGKNPVELFHPDDIAEADLEFAKMIQTGESCRHTWRMKNKNGEYRHLNFIANPYTTKNGELRVIVISSDITHQKELEKELEKKEMMFRILFEQAAVGVGQVENSSGKFVRVNQKFCDIMGYTREEIENLDFSSITHPDDLGKDYALLEKLKRNEISEYTMDKRYLKKDGSILWVNLTVSPMWLPEETPEYNIGVVVDITERKKAEEEIQNLLQEKEVLLREVHHRIKNNMTLISSFLSLQSSHSKDPHVFAILNETNSRILTMMMIYDQLYVSTDFKHISVEKYLNGLIAQIAMTFPDKTNIAIQSQIDSISLDSKKLFPIGIIINELVSNALKYAFSENNKGEISIIFRRNSQNQLELIVKDNGVGLQPELDLKAPKTFGLQLVSVLTKQLKCNVEIIRENGTQFIISMND